MAFSDRLFPESQHIISTRQIRNDGGDDTNIEYQTGSQAEVSVGGV